jgi:hypothetical protein
MKTLYKMKKLFLILFSVVLGVCLSGGVWGQATLPHLDAINYTVGQGLQTQTGWTSLNSGDALLIASGSLSYSGLEASSANKVTFDAAGIDAAKLFTQQTSGTVYYSFLLNVTTLGSLNATGGYFTGLNEGTGTTFGGTVWTRLDGTGYDIGINPRTTAANTVWSSGTTSINTTILVVISYQIVSGTTNDIVKMWINPTPGSTEPAPTLSATNTLTDLANLNRILIRQDGTTATPFIEMDELRVGSTWASVTPPSYTVTYNGNGNTGGSAPTDANSPYASGASVTVLGNTGFLTKTGFTFNNWNTAADGSGTAYSAGETFTITANRVLYAQWTATSSPTITVSTTTLTGFNYTAGSGPSTEQTFTVSGTNLTADISIAAPTNYEISKTSGSGYTTPLTFTQTGGTVTSTTVYVRLKAGLSAGNYNSEDITATSSGATNKTVTCSGSVTALTPTITLTPTTLTGFTYVAGSGPSTEQTFTVSGANLTANISIAAPTNFEVSLSSGSGYSSPLTLTPSSGTVSSTTIYVRLKSGLSTGNYNSETITASSTGATNKTVTCSGTVTSSIPPVDIIYQGFESLPSDTWTYSTTGTVTNSTTRAHVGSYSGRLDGSNSAVTFDNIDISDYTSVVLSVAFSCSGVDSDDDLYLDISYNDGSTWTGTGSVKLVDGYSNANILFGNTNASNPTTVAANPWTVNIGASETQIRIRLRYDSGASGEYYYIDDVKLSGIPTGSFFTLSPLTSFGNICTSTTAGPNSFTITGTSLTTADVTVAALSGYTYSTTAGGTYTSTLTLTQAGGSYSQAIYVKFSPSAVQSYNGNIVIGGGGATSKNCAATGSGVNSPPTISTPASSNITASSADLGGNITATGCSNVTKRGIFWSTTSGFADGAGTEVSETAGAPYSTGTFTVNVSGLSASTVYYFKAFTENSAGRVYTIQGTFTTLCNNETIPYSQGFNSATIPTCWTKAIITDTGTDPALTFQASNTYPPISSPQEGTQFVKFNSYNATDGSSIRLVSPPITTTGLTGINMDFIWYESPNYSTYLLEGMTVQYSLNGGTSWTDVEFFQRYNSISGWKDKTTTLPAAAENQPSVLIGFLFYSENGYDCVFDDLYIYTCSEPTTNSTGLSFSNVTNSTVDLSISTPGNGTKRIIVAREAAAVSFAPVDNTTYEAVSVFADAADLGSGNKVVYNGTGTSVTVSGLEGNTTYYFKVYEYNCSEGNENYYTGGTILAGSVPTLISPVTNLQVLCQTNTTAEISWTAPVGDYTGVIIGVRNDALLPHSISDDAADYNADVIFGDGTEYGTTNPKSYVVYKGTGTSVTVTGLTPGGQYTIKAYAYLNATGSTWAATQPTTSIANLSTADVTGNFVLAGNTELQLQWTNPGATCFDEVMIIGNAGAAITTQPSGDGSAYSGNQIFGSGTSFGSGFVVYKGGYSPQTITGLTNGVEYCFTWFVRNGTTWSTGVSGCGTPTTVTILEAGDLAIVAVNTQAQSSGSADEICFFSFKDITEGTSIDFTDNGYERLTDGTWASSEGTLRMTRSGGGTIPAGQVICFQGQGSTQAGFDVFTCGDEDNANWTITSLNNVGATSGSYDLNVDDQIWIMQNGAWDNGGSLSAHDATYSGNVLYGWTATGWYANPGYDDTHGSTLYPETECFNTNVAVAADHSKVKYIGATTTTSQFDWLTRINDDANWMVYATNAAYFAARDYSGTCFTFISDQSISGVAGIWTGADNEDWFDCGNWQDLRIPNGSNNVTISGAVSNNITIDNGISSMPEAECNNITISSDALVAGSDIIIKVNNASSVFNIYGDFENNQIVQHTNGKIHFKGNFENNDTYNHNTAGTAIFDGSGAQTITGATRFHNLEIDNSSSGITLGDEVTVSNVLTLTDGLINTGTNTIIIDNNSTSAIIGHSTASYINGNLRRKVAATGSYDLPVGSGSNYELANINLTTSTIDYLNASFTNSLTGTSLPTSPYLTVDGTDLTEILNSGFWTITPVTGTSTSYDVTLTSRGQTNGGTLATQHTVIKRDNSSSAWAAYEGNHINGTQTGTGTAPITAQLTLMSGFSDFAIAKSEKFPLPVELLFFNAIANDKTVNLNWETASEINNDYFIVERSANGREYEAIGHVNGNGNSSEINKYVFSDDQPYLGLSYYRLKQVDYDGAFEYSNIESVMINSIAKLNVSSILDPDFAASLLIENPNGSDLIISIFDMSGKSIYSEKIIGSDQSFKLQITKTNLKPGMYIFKVFSDLESDTEKVIVF